jgi:hypothetical protein
LKVRDFSGDEHFMQMKNSPFDEIGEGEGRRRNPQEGVEVRSSQIGIDEDHP